MCEDGVDSEWEDTGIKGTGIVVDAFGCEIGVGVTWSEGFETISRDSGGARVGCDIGSREEWLEVQNLRLNLKK